MNFVAKLHAVLCGLLCLAWGMSYFHPAGVQLSYSNKNLCIISAKGHITLGISHVDEFDDIYPLGVKFFQVESVFVDLTREKATWESFGLVYAKLKYDDLLGFTIVVDYIIVPFWMPVCFSSIYPAFYFSRSWRKKAKA